MYRALRVWWIRRKLRRRAHKMLGDAIEMVLESEMGVIAKIKKIETITQDGEPKLLIEFKGDGLTKDELKKLERITGIIDFRKV